MKVLFVSSAGGHYSELKKINLDEKYQKIVVTEKNGNKKENNVNYYLKYGTRQHKIRYIGVFGFNSLKALYILLKEKPQLIISTGAHTCVPFFYLAKVFSIKTIYIESYAKVNTSSLTYKLIKNYCTKVIVQHKELQDEYENSLFFGGVY